MADATPEPPKNDQQATEAELIPPPLRNGGDRVSLQAQIATAEREEQILVLAARGVRHTAIAKQFGMTGAGVGRALRRVIGKIPRQTADEYRTLILERYQDTIRRIYLVLGQGQGDDRKVPPTLEQMVGLMEMLRRTNDSMARFLGLRLDKVQALEAASSLFEPVEQGNQPRAMLERLTPEEVRTLWILVRKARGEAPIEIEADHR